MNYNTSIHINKREISIESPVYFIADIASNHDGDLQRAKELIWKAKESGADAVKFQHFKADKIVSDYGFKNLGEQKSHQAAWKKSIYEIYQDYECNRSWNEDLALTAQQAGIDFMTTPYDIEAVEQLDRYIPAYKIGSGDITWTDFIEFVAQKGKPVLLATGASTIDDVERAVAAIIKYNKDIVLMQCNTNYTGNLENFNYINLRVLQTFAIRYPSMLLGLSDHTPGHATVLGAIALGARVVEKHFTDDNHRIGPDHAFSMNSLTWADMIDRARELQMALGAGIKRIEANEQDTVIVQRRCIRVKQNLPVGHSIQRSDLECLRPAPQRALLPYQVNDIIGKVLSKGKNAGDALYPDDWEE